MRLRDKWVVVYFDRPLRCGARMGARALHAGSVGGFIVHTELARGREARHRPVLRVPKPIVSVEEHQRRVILCTGTVSRPRAPLARG